MDDGEDYKALLRKCAGLQAQADRAKEEEKRLIIHIGKLVVENTRLKEGR